MYHALLLPRARGRHSPPSSAVDNVVARQLDPVTAFDIHTQTVQELDIGTATEVTIVTQVISLPVTSIFISSDSFATSSFSVFSIAPPTFTSDAASSASITSTFPASSTNLFSIEQPTQTTSSFFSSISLPEAYSSTSPAAATPTPLSVTPVYVSSRHSTTALTTRMKPTTSTKQTPMYATQSASHPFATADPSLETATPAPSHRLAPAVIGAIVASVLAFLIVLGLVFFLYYLRRQRKMNDGGQEYFEKHDPDGPPLLPSVSSPGPAITIDPVPYAYWQRPSEPSPERQHAVDEKTPPLDDTHIMPLQPQMAQVRHYVPDVFASTATPSIPRQYPQPRVLGTALLADPFSDPSSSSYLSQGTRQDYPRPLRPSIFSVPKEQRLPPLATLHFPRQLSTVEESSYPPPLGRNSRLPAHSNPAEPQRAHLPTSQQPRLQPPPRNPRRMTSHSDMHSLYTTDVTNDKTTVEPSVSPDSPYIPTENAKNEKDMKPHPSTWVWRTRARSSISSVSSGTEFEYDGDGDENRSDDALRSPPPPAESTHLHPPAHVQIPVPSPARSRRFSANGSTAGSAWTGEASRRLSGRRRSDPFEFDSEIV